MVTKQQVGLIEDLLPMGSALDWRLMVLQELMCLVCESQVDVYGEA